MGGGAFFATGAFFTAGAFLGTGAFLGAARLLGVDVSFIGARKYLDPDAVSTTDPPAIVPRMGEVVTASPSPKEKDPFINPVTELSLFFSHFDMVGTSLGARDSPVCGGVSDTDLVAAGDGSSFSSFPPKMPKREMVAPGLALLKEDSACFSLAAPAAAAFFSAAA